jgi:hypothetical protein
LIRIRNAGVQFIFKEHFGSNGLFEYSNSRSGLKHIFAFFIVAVYINQNYAFTLTEQRKFESNGGGSNIQIRVLA